MSTVPRDRKVQGGAEAIDWATAERWDRAYYLHAVQAQAEFSYIPIERTDGSYLVMPDGTRLLDFQSQLISDSMGHRHPRIHAEIARAMERYGHVFFGLATDYRARAAKLLIEDVLGSEDWPGRVRILSSGSEAVENAFAMARHFTGRPVILTQEHSYHGMLMGPTRLRGYRGQLTPPAGEESRDIPGFAGDRAIVEIPAPEFYDYDGPRPLPSLEQTRAIIEEIGADQIAAVVTEAMFGAAGLLPPDDYLVGLRELSKEYDFLWIADEVLTGFGRLGEWFAYQCYPGIEPDLMVIGKGLNGCALPCGGVVARTDIAEWLEQARWWSGSTHDAHPLVCASIVGSLEAMIEDDVMARVKQAGAYLESELRQMSASHASVGRVSGKGMYFAVDLVDASGEPIVPADRSTLFLGELSDQPNNLIARECAARGVFLGGFVPNTIKVAPPFTVSDEEIDVGLAAFDAALDVLDAQIARA
ncbi:MAG: aspartate aminotransferase family protein [Gaiellaceae bacterium]